MKKNKSSKSWIIQQHRDQYFKQAKSSGYRSRSAYKLLELNKKFNFFKNCSSVIDLGSYPGGWSQVLKKNLKKCEILAIDIKKMEKIEGVDFICCDFLEEGSKDKIIKRLQNKADLLISDMAADTTGNKDLDCIRTNALCAEVINFSSSVVKDNGVVIAKLFNGKDFLDVKNLAENKFCKVNFFKPDSSRDYSKETYIHCAGIKTL
jgi:23S rRNA (uridine2552-2'-O)-methyltransferase|tara:strand:+ start:1418 stop:2035 length:618 start_codon:yes stop_codon:yes gene_type:complete